MGRPKISVIVPVFNGARTLETSLHSVWTQTYQAYELLVIDGASTDGTLSILQANKERIHVWLSEPDKGVYDAINKGIERAKGEWIFILGSDDVLAEQDVLERMAKHLLDNKLLFFGNVRNLHTKQSMVKELHTSSLGMEIYIRNTLHQQSAFYNSRLFDNTLFDTSLRVLGDYDFHLSLYQRGIRGEHVDLLVARCDASGLSKQFNWALYREELWMKSKRIGLLATTLLSPLIVAKFLFKQLK